MEALQRTPPPRASISETAAALGFNRWPLFVALTMSAAVVGCSAGIASFIAATSVGAIQVNGDRSGVFVDGTGAFWAGLSAVVGLIGAYGIGHAAGHVESASVRTALVSYRRAVENWRDSVEREMTSAIGRLNALRENLETREREFRKGFIAGRHWLAAAFADLFAERDSARAFVLRTKPHPALSSANVVKESKAEKRILVTENRYLKMQLASYEEYFPELADYRELILDEAEEFIRTRALDDIDPVLRFLSQDEYRQLSVSDRNQRALDRFTSRHKSDWEIGRQYERQIGWQYETNGWRVDFQGALKGLEDFGRDLIVKRDGQFESSNVRTGPHPR